jgi:ribosomal protein S27AE
MKGDDEFMKLGVVHAAGGLPRYKFHDPHLQKLYDTGYDLEGAVQKLAQQRARCAGCGDIFNSNGQHNYCGRCRF